MFTYKKIGWRSIELTGLLESNDTTELVIPEIYKKRKVISIGDAAFENTGIETLTLPSSIKEINKDSFANNDITEIAIEECHTVDIPEVHETSFSNNAIKMLRGFDSFAFWAFAQNPSLKLKYLEISKSKIGLSYDEFLRYLPKSVEGVYVERNILDTIIDWSISRKTNLTVYTEVDSKYYLGSLAEGKEIVKVRSAEHFRNTIKLAESY